MEQVDRALLINSGIRGTDLSAVEVEENAVVQEPQDMLDIFQSMGQQLRFWKDIGVKVSLIKNEIILRDKQIARKSLVKEVACLESIIAYVDTEQLVKAFQESIEL